MSDFDHTSAELVLLAFETAGIAFAVRADEIGTVVQHVDRGERPEHLRVIDVGAICERPQPVEWHLVAEDIEIETPSRAALAYVPTSSLIDVPAIIAGAAAELGIRQGYWDDTAQAFRWLIGLDALREGNEEAA